MIIEISVITAAGRQGFVLEESGILKCYLKSVPERGKANAELIKLLSKKLGISNDRIGIISGRTFRKKKIKIDVNDMDYESLLKKLGLKE